MPVRARVKPQRSRQPLAEGHASLHDREGMLREMRRYLAADLAEEQVLELAANQVTQLIGAPYVRIWLVETDGTLRQAAATGYESGDAELTLATETLTRSALRRDHVVVVDDVSHCPSWTDSSLLERTSLRPYLAVPVQRAEPLGVVVAMRAGNAIFHHEDEQLLVSLADAIAAALANARVLARLADSEQRQRVLFEAIACGVLIQDPDGIILHANSAAEEMFGYSFDEMHGRSSGTLWKTVGEDGVERPPTARNISITARTGVASRNFTTCIIAPQGSRRWLQGNCVAIRGFDGSVQVVSSFIDITDRKRAEEAITHRASHDPLTGLPNRSLLGERLRQSIAEGDVAAAPVGLLLIDLNGFKEVNDTLGHHAGDLLLQRVAERLRDAVCTAAVVARVGGDEFAILLPNAGAEESLLVAGALLEALRPQFVLEGQAVAVSGSVGVSSYPMHGQDFDTLLRRADVAMYVAKRSGLGARLFSAEMEFGRARTLPSGDPLTAAA